MLSPICLSVIPPLHVFSLPLFFSQTPFSLQFLQPSKEVQKKKATVIESYQARLSRSLRKTQRPIL